MSQVADPGTANPLQGDGEYGRLTGGGGPVDATPVDHTTGIGVGAGLPLGASEAQNEAWHEVDYGATAARRWQAPESADGHQVTERLTQPVPIGELGSPGFTESRIGTSPVSYPNAQRTGSRMHFWRDRVFDRRTFTTDHRPLYTPNAYDAPAVPAGNSQYTSPFPQLGHVHTLLQQAPQQRRQPPGAGDAVVTDGTGVLPAPVEAWGL